MLVVASACGGTERRAERLWRRALERVEKGDTPGGVDDFQKLITMYPDAQIAGKAREQIVVYRGLANAIQSYPMRRARELMVQVSRAIESFKRERGRAPETLDELVPGKLADVPLDPWNHPFEYEMTARGYRLCCLGSDGSSGGDGDASDLNVVDGAFVTASR
jgi:Type II secretion system (T2SS), protein G